MPFTITRENRASNEGFDIDQFYARIKSGIQRTNKFLVRIYPPPLMLTETIFVNMARQLEFYCMAAPVPGYTVGTHEVLRYSYGPTEKKPFTPIFTDVTLVFIGDSNGMIHKFFSKWMDCVLNKDNRFGDLDGTGTPTAHGVGNKRIDAFEVNYKEDYETTVEVISFADDGLKSQKTVLQEAFPIMVPDIQYNWGEMNNVTAIPVTFTFFSWFIEELKYSNVNINYTTPN